MSGVYWYAGISQSGKTTLALAHVARDIESSGRAALIVDPACASNLRGEYHAESVRETIDRVWGRDVSTAYTPSGIEDFDSLMRAAHAGRDRTVLIDEAFYFCSGRAISKDLSRVLRTHAHGRNTYRLTTQHIGDIASEALAATTEVYLFASVSESALDRIRERGWADPEAVRALSQGEYFTHRVGFAGASAVKL